MHCICQLYGSGLRSVKKTIKRADVFEELAKKFGANMTEIYWKPWKYDLVEIIEAPDDEPATAFALAISAQALRAFSRDEMNGILGKMA